MVQLAGGGTVSTLAGLASDITGLDLTGEGAAGAATEAAKIQAEATKLGVEEARLAREQARADLSPFREAGQAALPGLTSLITDPNAQKNFITQNPFFSALAQDAQNRLFSNAAARGKVGSGGTAAALQNSLLLLGNDLVNQSISQRFNLATIGSNAAAGQATASQNAAANIANLQTQGANATAAGIIGAANARTQAQNQLLQLGTSAAIAASDQRVKRDIEKIGTYKDLNLYSFKYIWSDDYQIGFMAQEVQKLYPEAVLEINGILHVDYAKVMYAH